MAARVAEAHRENVELTPRELRELVAEARRASVLETQLNEIREHVEFMETELQEYADTINAYELYSEKEAAKEREEEIYG